MTGLDITAVASANQFIRTNLPGGGGQNASCAGVKQKDESAYPDPDNGESAGFVLTYGRFRTIDLGDLTWNGELDLMCPTNRIGTVDLYLTSHHGLEKSGSPALVQALRPRVVVMNNGTRKGGTPEVFAGLQETVGIEDLWQLHWSYNVGLENAPARFIANVDDPATIATRAHDTDTGLRRRRAAEARRTRWPGAATAHRGRAPAAPGTRRPGGAWRPGAARRARPGRGPGGPARAHARLPDQGDGAAGRHVHGDQHAQRVQQDLSAAAVSEAHVLVATVRSVRQPRPVDGGLGAAGRHALLRPRRVEEACLGGGAERIRRRRHAGAVRLRHAGAARRHRRRARRDLRPDADRLDRRRRRSFSTTSPAKPGSSR